MMATMRAADELVAVFDAAGRVTGVAARGIVYRDGIWHGGTGVLVRSGDGARVYLHRRAPGKLLWPDRYDCWAGGVIGPGENPVRAAERELAEELGIAGVVLTPIGHFPFVGDGLRCHQFVFEVRWDGPVVHQPEEIVWGEWITVGELRTRLADHERWPFVPDGRLAIEWWLTSQNGT